MNVKVRLTEGLVKTIRADLSRPHPFASERVGFLYGRLARPDKNSQLITINYYQSLPDDRYVDDPYAGARIDSHAIRTAMQGVLDRNEGVFHVHMHHWPGSPTLSPMDADEIPKVVTGFRRVGPSHAHGIFLLHTKECGAWVWMPGNDAPVIAASVSIVGFPIHFSYGIKR